MSHLICGSAPRLFPAGGPQHFNTLKTVYGSAYEGKDSQVVPEGFVLVVPQHGYAPESGRETRHEFPAGTRFKIIRAGNPYLLAVTELMDV